MQIFLDTADVELIKKWLPTGVIDGVTTNPTHLSKTTKPPRETLREICSLVPGDVSIEVTEHEPEAVMRQALDIAAFAKNAVVKIPFGLSNLAVMKDLVARGVKINVTLVFSVQQAHLVSKIGVAYYSLMLGRWDEIGIESAALTAECAQLRDTHGYTSKLLVASVRTIQHWRESLLNGADIITMPPSVFEQAFKHPLLEKGIAQFDADWQKSGFTSVV